MPKFYVKSGRVKGVVDRSDAVSAAYAVVYRHAFGNAGKAGETDTISQLGLMTRVSERGFNNRDGESFPTHSILVNEGPFERFEPGALVTK